MKKSPQAPKVAINSKERIKYIYVTKYVTKLGSLQNKRQDQQQALLKDVVAEKTKQKQ
ncbi:hypothetical protein KVL00_02455 [Helicobacter pylori]|nr:hypothetical protein KVL00_02455 [Helicobacter pylori]